MFLTSAVPDRGPSATLEDWRVLRWTGLGIAGVVVLALWWLIGVRFDTEQSLLVRNARVQQAGLSAIVADQLNQLADRGRFMALAADAWFERDHLGAAATLTTLLAQDAMLVRVSLFDPELRRVYTSSPEPDGDLWSRRLSELKLKAEREVQAIDVATEARGIWQLPLLYTLPDAHNGVRGYLLLMVDVGQFLRFYRHFDLGQSGAIQWLDDQGKPLVVVGSGGLVVPGKTTGLPVWPEGMSRSGAAQGSFKLDGAEHLWSLRRAERSPFMVRVSQRTDEVMQAHADGNTRIVATAALISAVLMAAAWALARGVGRQQQLFMALSEADREKHTLIEQLEREKGRAIALASLDDLSGLHNRRMFCELVASHLARARRSRKHHALVYLDLDRFKAINDSLGHHVGDMLLRAVSDRLRQGVRSSDIVGRMGGDEFAVLITDLDTMGDMNTIATKLLHQLSQPYHRLDGHDLMVSPSMGIAFFPRDGHDVDSLCRHADAAMYQSKRAGRGRFSYYETALNPTDNRRFTLERQLPQALAQGQFVLHYQPKLALANQRVTGFEALVRWQHPEFGLITPGDFVPLAEQTGFILPLGDWVLSESCRQLGEWRRQGLQGFSVAVNVSPHQLRDPALAQRVQQLMAEHGLQAGDLEIEITESCLVEPLDQAVAVLEALERLGVTIGLDDFGSGFSSLSQIKNLPIHTIKIDRSFINDVRTSNDVCVIVTSIVTLAHNLGMKVVAEGVELMTQLVFLKTAGCDEVQGYFLSRPLPPEHAARLVGADARPLMGETA